MSDVFGVWGTDTIEGVGCPYCDKGNHKITFYKYSPNKKWVSHYQCRACCATVKIELPGPIIKVEPPMPERVG